MILSWSFYNQNCITYSLYLILVISFSLSLSLSLYIYIYIYIYMCVCVCVCICIHTHTEAQAHTLLNNAHVGVSPSLLSERFMCYKYMPLTE